MSSWVDRVNDRTQGASRHRETFGTGRGDPRVVYDEGVTVYGNRHARRMEPDFPDYEPGRDEDDEFGDGAVAASRIWGDYDKVRSTLESVKSLRATHDAFDDDFDTYDHRYHDANRHNPREAQTGSYSQGRPQSGPPLPKASTESAHRPSSRQSTKSYRTAASSATPDDWAELARRGNAEVNVQRLTSSRPTTGESKQSMRLPSEEKRREPEDSSAEEGTETDRKKQAATTEYSGTAELSAITQLRLQLERLKAEQEEERKLSRNRHAEELAKVKSEVAEESRKRHQESLTKLERRLSTEKAKYEEDRLHSKQTIDSLASELNDLRNEVAEEKNRNKQLVSNNKTYIEEIRRKSEAAENASRDYREADTELNRLRSEYEKLKAACGRTEMQLSREKEHLRSELAMARDDAMHLRKSNEALIHEKDEIVKEYDRLQQRLEKKYKKMDQQVEEGVRKWKTRKEELEVELQERTAELEKVRAELLQKTTEYSELKLETKDALKEADNLTRDAEKENALLREKVQHLEQRLADKATAIQHMESELADLRPKVEQLLIEKAEGTKLIDNLTQHLAKEKQHINHLEQAKVRREEESQDTINTLKSELADRERKLAKLAGFRDSNQELSRCRAELAQWKQNCEALREELEDLRAAKKPKERTKPPVPKRSPHHTPKATGSSAAPAAPQMQLVIDDSAMDDDDIRPLEIKKRQIQEELHWQRTKAAVENDATRLLSRIRQRVQLGEDSSSSD